MKSTHQEQPESAQPLTSTGPAMGNVIEMSASEVDLQLDCHETVCFPMVSEFELVKPGSSRWPNPDDAA